MDTHAVFCPRFVTEAFWRHIILFCRHHAFPYLWTVRRTTVVPLVFWLLSEARS